MPETAVTDSVPEAAAALRSGALVAFPTETVYGLGAHARDADAVRRVFRAKGRPSDNPLIVHVDHAEAVEPLAVVTAVGRRLLDAFAPGPLTVVLPARPGLPPEVTAGLRTVAVRVPRQPTAHALLAAAGVPVVAPSANRSGRPSPTTWEAVLDDLGGRIDWILTGGPTEIGLESTVVDATGPRAVLLRPGAVSLDALRAVVPTDPLAAEDGRAARSPGLRHRHYAPRARVRIVAAPEPRPDAAFIGLEAPPDGYGLVALCPDADAYARRVFAFFREADSGGLAEVHVQGVGEAGIGAALMDRLRRAAAG